MTDLSHLMTNGMPVFPGSKPVIIESAASMDSKGYNELRLTISGHNGTHIDCGLHVIDGGFDTGSSPVQRFYGKGILIDCTGIGPVISANKIRTHENRIKRAEFVLLYTGWSRFWGESEYFGEFPVLNDEAAALMASFQLKGIGVDAPSFDPVNSTALPVHHKFLSAGIILIENLTNLKSVDADEFIFCCLPLKIKDGDGSPVRAVAIINEM